MVDMMVDDVDVVVELCDETPTELCKCGIHSE